MKRLLAFSLACLAIAGGCSRTFYRQRADEDAYCLIDHKARAAKANPGDFRIDVDPRSRMFDPYDPDIEPMPPDDPQSNRYMQVVDCKKGSKDWRKLPRTPYVDNPNWQAFLPRNERGDVELDMRGAVELALLHSPDYQQELEDLYLSALDVSFERFRFDAQFFGGSEVFITAEGRDRPGNNGESQTVFEVIPLGRNPRPGSRLGGTNLRVERFTATGGELVVGAANSLMWQFAGPNDYRGTTLLDFTFVQPLLRAGGRTRVLERLTIAERTLLANIRQMERYRGGFYLNVVTGQDAGQGPSRRGGFFGGSGLEGFAGVGGGGFGNVGNFGFGGFGGGFGFNQGVGGGFTGGAGAQAAGGYIGLLQTAQQIRNQRSNIAALNDSFEQLEASAQAGRIDRFQVDLARQALYNAQSQLLTSEALYESTLDNFKVSFGLPPELPVVIKDPLLDRFNLLDPDLDAVVQRVSRTLASLRELRQAQQADPPPNAEQQAAISARFDALLEECIQLEAAVKERLAAVEADMATLDAALPRRREYLERLVDRPELASAQIDASLLQFAELERRTAQRRQDFETLKTVIEQSWDRLAELEQNDRVDVASLLPVVVDSVADLSSRLLELSLVQAGARLEAIVFEPIDLTEEQALRIASAYRQDWQNARAALVDSWRLIYFNANDLKSDLDIVFSGDISNLGDNPFRIRDTTGRLSAGIQFDAPLTRLSERNVYRQSLIEFQQARRSYYQFRDRVLQDLRRRLRQVRLNEINFELRRAAVLVAISQVDLTQLRLSQPPQPAAAGETAAAQFGVTTARDLVQSLSDLLNVQNDFLSVWVNYEVQRMGLDFDLGVMQLDPSGIRQEQEAPLVAYLAGAEAIHKRLCSPSDLYPGVGQVFEAAPGVFEVGPEVIPPPSMDPGGESAAPGAEPLPPPARSLQIEPLGLDDDDRWHDLGVALAAATKPIELPPPEQNARREATMNALGESIQLLGAPNPAENTTDQRLQQPYNQGK